MRLVLLALRAVGCGFFWHIHRYHYWFCIKKTNTFLYLFTLSRSMLLIEELV